jgi:hypothetical protein
MKQFSVSEEIANIIANMDGNENRHTILHITRTAFYNTESNKNKKSQGRKTCTNIYNRSETNEHDKCQERCAYWWCVECTYRNPLVPTYLCAECANIDKNKTTTKHTVLKETSDSRCHINNLRPKSFFELDVKKRKFSEFNNS